MDTHPVASIINYASWEDTLNSIVDSTGGQWIGPVFVPPDLNLAQDGVRTRIKRGISDNLFSSANCHSVTGHVARLRPMFDGDFSTAAFFSASASEDIAYRNRLFVHNGIVDLGADFPINRVRFFPRLGTSNPKIDEILGSIEHPLISKEDLPEEDFSVNFLPWFEVSAANSFNNFAVDCFLSTPENPWFTYIRGSNLNAANDPRLVTLRKETENLDVVVDIRFPTQQYQWIAIRPINPIGNWEIAEFEIYGQGFVEKAVYTTTVLDFGTPMAWGKIRWDGVFSDATNVLIRTRSGNDPDPNLYWQPSSLEGELQSLTRREWERADASARLTTLDKDNWSFWSAPYPLDAGQRDTTLAAENWLDGTPILSPGPSRYMQLQIVFLSTLDQAGKLRELEIQFAPPAALEVVGEIWPQDVSRLESTRFTYSVRPTFATGDTGFDRLEIFTLTHVDTVRVVRFDGAVLGDQFPTEILDDRILIWLPKLQGSEDTFKLIEVEFDVHVVRYGTQFHGWVFDSQGSGVKQLIEAGDANIDFPGNALGVRTDDLGSGALAQVEVAPNPFTPNADGINDEIFFRFQLHDLSEPRELKVVIYDLSGRQVRQLKQQEVIRGLFDSDAEAPVWDGLDDGGAPVPPGHYIYRISLDADEETDEQTGAISVVY
jgi:hypothetical protein